MIVSGTESIMKDEENEIIKRHEDAQANYDKILADIKRG